MRKRTMIDERELEAGLERIAGAVEPLDDAALTGMARAASASGRTFARSRRQPLRIAVAAALALGVAALLPAMFSGDVRGLLTREASAQPPVGVWRWDQLVPGRSTKADARLRRSVRKLGVVPARIHRLGRPARPVLLAAADRLGRVCFATRTASSLSNFKCVSLLSSGSLVVFASGSTVLGIARSDVERIVAARADGSEQELRLNRWRAFEASRRGGFAWVKAYRGDGTLVERVAVGDSLRSRLCGAAAEPCPPAL